MTLESTMPNYIKAKQVDFIADKIMERLNTEENRKFYCKVAWKLTEATIWNNMEIALKGDNPQRYFSFLCKLAIGD